MYLLYTPFSYTLLFCYYVSHNIANPRIASLIRSSQLGRSTCRSKLDGLLNNFTTCQFQMFPR